MRGVRVRRGDGCGTGRRDDGRRDRRALRARRPHGATGRRFIRADGAGDRAPATADGGSRGGRVAGRGGAACGGRRGERRRSRGRRRRPGDRSGSREPGAQGRDPRPRVEGDRRHHRHQHLVAADRGAGRQRRAAGAAPRRALVQPAGVDAGHGGDRGSRDGSRGGGAGPGVPQRRRQGARRGRRPRRLRLQPPADGAAARGAGDRRRGPDHARGPRHDRPQHLRFPAPVLRPVPDRRHGGAGHLRRRLQDARTRRRAGVRAAAGARRARGGGACRREGRGRVRGLLRRGARAAAARARPPLRGAGEAARGMIDASVLVVGGGAIGGVTAAKLTGAVRRVVVLDASDEHVARLNDGLKLDELGQERTVEVEAVTTPPDEEFDFVLVTLKAAHHEAVKPLKGTFVSLGNGLVQERLEQLVGQGNLISGIVEWGATNLGPGHLAQTTSGPFVVGPPSDRTQRLAEVLAPAGEVRVADDIASVIWAKLLVNSVFSGLGAVAGQTYAELVANPAGKAVALRMWREGYEVGLAQGLYLGKVLGVEAKALADGDTAALATAMEGHGATYASMLQDLERGAATEVDVIDGAVVERGRECDIPTPLHERVTELIHAAERGERRPSPDALAELERL